ncbi:MAG TPA: hypothetical protein VJU61_18235 [Polyangiaceae bacterium]|nr:hypothetical protein [Polyangiaceae bacterium]
MDRVGLAACLEKWLGAGRGRHSQCETRRLVAARDGSARRSRGPRLATGWGLLGGALALALGCAPSRQALTAGEVGCAPGELSVQEVDSSSGWAQSAETWIAECRGRRFVCTEVVTSSLDLGWLFSDSVDSRDSDVSCHEELSASTSAAPEERAPALPSSTPPDGGAGFAFGRTRAEARARCEASGHAFRDEGAHAFCSGVATPLGFEASPRLTFCQDVLCGVTIERVPEQDWAAAFHDLDARLTEKYGPATLRQVRVPAPCRSDEDFDRCAVQGALDLEVRWQWPRGQRLRLLLDKPRSKDPAALRLIYVQPSSARRVDASGL